MDLSTATNIRTSQAKKALSQENQNKEIDLSKATNIRSNSAVVNKMATNAPSTTFVGNTGIGESQYDNNIALGDLHQLEKIRASKQGVPSQLANAFFGGVGSGLVGAVEGFSNVADQLMNIGNEAEEWERGALSQTLADIKKDINDLTPIYRKDRGDVFDWNDGGFYAEVLKGAVDSAVAFGLPGAGYGMAVGKLSSVLGKAALFGKRLDVIARAGGRAAGIANPANKIGAGASALLSNYNEGTVMGMQTYDEEKERFMKVLTEEYQDNKAEGESLTENDMMEIEKLSSIQAGQAAESVRSINHFMVASNYIGVKSLFKTASTASRGELLKTGKSTFKSWLKDQALAAPAEGLEEIGQGVLQNEVSFRNQKSFYEANGIDTSKAGFEEFNANKDLGFGERILDFATRDETLLEGLMGLVSGPIQFAVTGLPGHSKNKQAQQLRYNTQQGTIGKNEAFIKDKLTYQQTKDELIESFDKYRKEVLNNPEATAEDKAKYEDLIENTAFEQLAVENFFTGTTKSLEDQLTAVGADENATPEMKEASKTHLQQLGELEKRYNDFQMYQDGAHMFTAQLRAERLSSINNTLTEAYVGIERDLTKALNSRLERNAKQNKNNKLSKLEDLAWYFDEQETTDTDGKVTTTKVKVPIRSVTQGVEAAMEGKQIYTDSAYKSIDNFFKPDGEFTAAFRNKELQLGAKNRLAIAETALAESKLDEYENEFAVYSDALAEKDSERKLTDLKTVQKDLKKKYSDDKYLNLQARVNANIVQLEKAIADAKMQQTAQTEEEVNTAKTESEKKKVAKKTGEQAPEGLTQDPEEELAAGMHSVVGMFDDPDVGEDQSDTMNTLTGGDNVPATPATTTPKAKAKVNKPIEITHNKKPYKLEIKEDGKVYFAGTNKEVKVKAIADKALKADESIKQRRLNYTKVHNDPKRVVVTIEERQGKVQYAITEDDKIYRVAKEDSTKEEAKKTFGYEEVGPKYEHHKKILQAAEAKRIANKAKPAKPADVSKAHLTADEDADYTHENFETKPTGKDDGKVAQANTKVVNKKAKTLIEGVDFNGNPTIAKVMTTGGTPEFQNNLLKNYKDKTNFEVDVEISQTVSPNTKEKTRLANEEAIAKYNELNKSGRKPTAEEMDLLVKYLPIGLNFGNNMKTLIYSMNAELDSSRNKDIANIPAYQKKYIDKQHIGEVDVRTKIILADLAGKTSKVKIKGQLPGELNFDTEEKMLSEINGFMENPMGVNMYISIDGSLSPVNKKTKRNPFTETFMTYTTAQGTDAWTGIIVIEIPALNGMKFPLKVNTKGHTIDSASILYTLYNRMVNQPKDKNLMSASIKSTDPDLFNQIKTQFPTIISNYGEDVSFKEVINDMVFEGTTTQGRKSELYFDKGQVHFNGQKYTGDQFQSEKVRTAFIQFIQDYKTFNVNVAKLGDPAYRKHVFSSYLSTNANINGMFTTNGLPNPTGDGTKRMQSGAMYIDTTSLVSTEVKKEVKKEVTVPASTTKVDTKKATLAKINEDEQKDLNIGIPINNYVFVKGKSKDVLIKFREYLIDVLGWERMPIGYSNKSVTLTYLGQEMRIPARILELGGGASTSLEITIEDVIKAKYQAERDALNQAQNKSGVEAQISELNKVEEVKPTSVKYYLSTPNSDGSFNQSSAKSSFTEGASMFSFQDIGNNKYEVYVSDNESAIKLALQYPDRNIDPVFNVISAYNPKAKSVQTINPAIVELINGKFKLISKGEIDYDNASIPVADVFGNGSMIDETDSRELSDAENGMQDMDGAEIAVLKGRQQALLPEPDPDGMTLEEYNEIEQEVKNSKAWKDIQKQIDAYNKSNNKPINKVDKKKQDIKIAEEKAVEKDLCKLKGVAAKKSKIDDLLGDGL